VPHPVPPTRAIDLDETTQPPAIGQPWPGIEASVYAGVTTNREGQTYALVLLADKPQRKLTWKQAIAWAGKVGGELPTRVESAMLFANVGGSFERDWHWTSEQSSEGYAWGQTFLNGGQYGGGKSYEGRARAVRRFNVQSFVPSEAS